ncbi:MAG: hypothetical protein MR940_06795, partial [Lachnospiraceae bacterium]|nr:hypothetical protein [Lachnospiraceae bacterium]
RRWPSDALENGERKTYSEEAEVICVLLHFTMRVPLPIRIRPEIYAAGLTFNRLRTIDKNDKIKRFQRDS